MVVISQSFELKEIVKNLLRKLEVKEDLLMGDEFDLLQLLSNQLIGKYLLILDDVWTIGEGESSWWESIKSALAQQDDGSCVIVTTRIERVARSMGANMSRIHHLQLLFEQDDYYFTK